MPAKKTAPKTKKVPMKKVGSKKPTANAAKGSAYWSGLSKKAKASKKSPRLKWDDLTPAQQAQLKKQYRAALAKARKDIAAGGRTYERTTADGYDVYASNEKLVLHITAECVKDACRSSKRDCVIARAIKKQQPFADGWEVGKRISMIFSRKSKEVIRYGTSLKLSRALEEFDRTGYWNLAYGYYTLNPLPAGYRVGTRWAWYKGSGGKASKFKGSGKVTRKGTYRSAIKKAA